MQPLSTTKTIKNPSNIKSTRERSCITGFKEICISRIRKTRMKRRKVQTILDMSDIKLWCKNFVWKKMRHSQANYSRCKLIRGIESRKKICWARGKVYTGIYSLELKIIFNESSCSIIPDKYWANYVGKSTKTHKICFPLEKLINTLNPAEKSDWKNFKIEI